MNKFTKNKILYLIIALQIVFPVVFVILNFLNISSVEKSEYTVKVPVDYIFIESDAMNSKKLYIENYEFNKAVKSADNDSFITFKKGENGFYSCEIKNEKPQNEYYLKHSVFHKDTDFRYESEALGKLRYSGVTILYEKDEKQTDKNDTYMLLKIYKNNYKVEAVFIEGVDAEEYVQKWGEGLKEHSYKYTTDDFFLGMF